MAAKKQPPAVYIATASGVCEIDGVPYVYVQGQTLVSDGHELLRAVPDYFAPASDRVHYGVEQATSAPGEKRG